MAKFLIFLFCPLSAYHLTIFIDARHLDYSSAGAIWRSLHTQVDPSFGHAWIRLEHEEFVLEGGHTGEFGLTQPRYLEGVVRYHQLGDPNPVRYLWEMQRDGCFQTGSGGHTATHRLEIPIDQAAFEAICTFIEEGRYPFDQYHLTRHQCTLFVVQVAALAGVILKHQVTVPIESHLGGLRLWSDPIYSEVTFSTPDILIQNDAVCTVLDSAN